MGNTLGVNVSGGSLQVKGNVSLPTGIPILINGAGLGSAGAINNVSDVNSIGGATTLGTDASIGSTAGTLTLNGNVAAAGHALTIGGAGNITVNSVISGSGSVAYTGSGTLSMPAGNLPSTSPIQLASGATLDMNGTFQQTPSLSNITGGGGTITNSIATPATLVLAPTSGSNTFSGSIQDGAGKVGVTFNRTGGASQIFNGSHNYTGPTNINSAHSF